MNQAEFLQSVHGHMKLLVSDGELGVSGYAWVLEELEPGDFSIKVMCLALPPDQAWDLAVLEAMQETTRQLVFCLDRNGKPEQNTLVGDLLAGFYYEAGAPELLKPFIVEYSRTGDRVLWFNWTNEFWRSAIKLEALQVVKGLKEKREELRKPEGTANSVA